MSTRLGTVPGWERASGWTADNRVYEGVGPTIDMIPEYAGEELADYWIKFDILFYFCESPPISPVVFRTLKDCMIRQIFVSPLKEPVPTFEKWTDDITETIIADLAEDIHRMSVIEMGGLRKCGISKEENYAITVTDKGFRVAPPKIKIPVDVLASIEVILREMKENLDNEDYIYELKKELDKILSRNRLTIRDIEDMIQKEKLEQIML
jgi:hypothetical protein